MPARPVILDRIGERTRLATVRDVILPMCCFPLCKKSAVFFVILRFKDGSTDVYAVCKKDFLKIKAQSAASLEPSSEQGVFLYP